MHYMNASQPLMKSVGILHLMPYSIRICSDNQDFNVIRYQGSMAVSDDRPGEPWQFFWGGFGVALVFTRVSMVRSRPSAVFRAYTEF